MEQRRIRSSFQVFSSDIQGAIENIFKADDQLGIAARRAKVPADQLSKFIQTTFDDASEKIRDEYTKLDIKVEKDNKKAKDDEDKAMKLDPAHILGELLEDAPPESSDMEEDHEQANEKSKDREKRINQLADALVVRAGGKSKGKGTKNGSSPDKDRGQNQQQYRFALNNQSKSMGKGKGKSKQKKNPNNKGKGKGKAKGKSGKAGGKQNTDSSSNNRAGKGKGWR